VLAIRADIEGEPMMVFRAYGYRCNLFSRFDVIHPDPPRRHMTIDIERSVATSQRKDMQGYSVSPLTGPNSVG
jgi:hypothetical protein